MKRKIFRISAMILVIIISMGLFACNNEHVHKYVAETISPTCVTEGYIKHTCKCGDTYNNNYVSAKGHSYVESIISKATCNNEGTKRFTCNCGDSYTQNYSLEELSPSEIYEEVKTSVGEIVTYDKSGNELALGTCFVYSSNGKIVTNYHVIEDAYSAKLTINNKNYVVNKILAYDKVVDIAVLSVSASLTPVKVCKKEHAVGKAVYAIGSSRGLTSTFTQGIITYANRELDSVNYVQHNAAISSGNSGGPLVNGFAEVIGINTMTIRDSQNLNFAIMINELDNLNYSTPLTFSEFYEKEADVFKKIKNHLISNGKYDREDNDYTLEFSPSYWNDTHKYKTGAYYKVDDDEIVFTNFVYKTTNSYDSIMSFLYVDEIDGVYEWSIIDGSANWMSGNVYANSFTSSTILSYTSKIGFTYSLYTARQIASQMICQSLEDLDLDFSSIGISAKDLGFKYID